MRILPTWLGGSTETKQANEQTAPLSGARLDNTFFRSFQTLADIQPIDADSIMQNPTAFACIDTLAKTIAQQPFQVVENGLVNTTAFPQGILERPNQDNTAYEMKYQLVVDLMTHGQAFVEVRRARAGQIRSWRLIPPQLMRVARTTEGETVLDVNPTQIGVQYRIENIIPENVYLLRDVSVSPIPGGLSRVQLMRRLVGLDNAIDRFAQQIFSRSLQVGSHVIVIPDILKPDEVDEIYERMKTEYAGIDAQGAGGTPVLEGGVQIQPITPIKPVDADMTALKTRTAAQIAATYGVPAALIELANGTANYNNVQQRYAGFYRDTIGPLSINISQKLNRVFSLPPNVLIQLDGSELLKGDYPTQVATATSAFRNGFWTLDEARAFTGQPASGEEFANHYIFEIEGMNAPTVTAGTGGDSGVDNDEGS